jgi:hypothetical protein
VNVTVVNNLSPPRAKVELFRSLFRGRDDVYPLRFESQKTGKSGYSPVCANEWTQGLCDKRKVKCVECPNRRFLPVTDDVIRYHLSGVDLNGRDFVAGVYPMLLDETCYFLAMDFDKKNWSDDIHAVRTTCNGLDVPCAVERSRSGNGAHLWIFFKKATPAVLTPVVTDKLSAFSDVEAYRRDRRKDVLLQEHGYFVLRFLAEDIGKNLDHVLDTIQRTLAHRLRT